MDLGVLVGSLKNIQNKEAQVFLGFFKVNK